MHVRWISLGHVARSTHAARLLGCASPVQQPAWEVAQPPLPAPDGALGLTLQAAAAAVTAVAAAAAELAAAALLCALVARYVRRSFAQQLPVRAAILAPACVRSCMRRQRVSCQSCCCASPRRAATLAAALLHQRWQRRCCTSVNCHARVVCRQLLPALHERCVVTSVLGAAVPALHACCRRGRPRRLLRLLLPVTRVTSAGAARLPAGPGR